MTGTTLPPEQTDTPRWHQLGAAIDRRDGAGLVELLEHLPPQETAYTISHLDPDRRSRMLSLLAAENPDLGADLMEHFDDVHAADMIEVLPAGDAAALVDQMDSDEQADVLAEIEPGAAEAILQRMSPQEAEDVRRRLVYGEDTAGGLMITEYLAYPADRDVKQVRRDLRRRAAEFNAFEVRYLYAVDEAGRLLGVVPMRNLVMAEPGQPLADAAIRERVVSVSVDESLDVLDDLFDRVDLMAIPVLDRQGLLAGVVRRAAVQEAVSEAAKEDLAKFGGIIGGEELRSMPAWGRAVRRLAFLLPVLGLTLISASVVWSFQGTIGRFPTLAAFLPVVAGVCGSSGGQAVAVSIRELSLGLLRPANLGRVMIKELSVAAIMGVSLGLTLFLVTWVWEADLAMALVVGTAVPVVVPFAVLVGGAVPVLLRGMRLDPAMMSGPIVQTVIDMVSFLVVLVLAALALARIAAVIG